MEANGTLIGSRLFSSDVIWLRLSLMQYSVAQLLIVTLYAGVLCALLTLGHYGISLIPLVTWIPSAVLLKSKPLNDACPPVLKLRWHAIFLAFAYLMAMIVLLFHKSFGLWIPPFNWVLTLLLIPVIIILQLIKNADPEKNHIQLRFVQVYSAWSVCALNFATIAGSE